MRGVRRLVGGLTVAGVLASGPVVAAADRAPREPERVPIVDPCDVCPQLYPQWVCALICL